MATQNEKLVLQADWEETMYFCRQWAEDNIQGAPKRKLLDHFNQIAILANAMIEENGFKPLVLKPEWRVDQ